MYVCLSVARVVQAATTAAARHVYKWAYENIWRNERICEFQGGNEWPLILHLFGRIDVILSSLKMKFDLICIFESLIRFG